MQEPKKICPSCGMPLAQDDVFCTICGTKSLAAAPAPAAPTAPPAYAAPPAPGYATSSPAPQAPPAATSAPATQPGGWGAPPPPPSAQPYQPAPQASATPQQPHIIPPTYASPGVASYPTAVKTKKSIAPLIAVLVVLLLAAGGFCVWFFMLRDTTPVVTGPRMVYADWPSDINAPVSITEGYIKKTGDIDIYGFTVDNTGTKTIKEYDILLFCYDKNGRPIFDEYGENFEIDYSKVTIPIDGSRTEEFEFYYSSMPELCIPFVSYILFDDGTEWGIYWDFDDLAYQELISKANGVADSYAKKVAP